MFVSTPSYEYAMPAPFAMQGTKHWLALELATSLPWFLATFRLNDEGTSVHQTMLVAWETTLMSLVRNAGSASLVTLQCLACSSTSANDWKIGRVNALWIFSETTASSRGPLGLELHGEAGIFDVHMKPIEAHQAQPKKLVWRAM